MILIEKKKYCLKKFHYLCISERCYCCSRLKKVGFPEWILGGGEGNALVKGGE